MSWISPSSKDQLTTVVDLGQASSVFVASNVVIASQDVTIAGDGSKHQALIYGTTVGSGSGLFTIFLGDNPAADNGQFVHVMQGGHVETLAVGVGVACYGYDSEVINDGIISSPGGEGVLLRGVNASTQSTLVNTGLIEGFAAVTRGGFDAVSETIVVRNSGILRGEYASYSIYGPDNGPASDLITNTGKMFGKVELFGGDDLYDGRKGYVDSVVLAGAGDDRVYGGRENNMLQGEDGEDRLIGGLGGDQLSGGAGKDLFIFKSLADSTAKLAGRDVISDFSHAEADRIDLKAIDADVTAKGNQEFDFIGKAAFSGEAGELRFQKKGGDTFVYADVNGDHKADMTLALDSLLTLDATDFVL